jgi:hypothetical protein
LFACHQSDLNQCAAVRLSICARLFQLDFCAGLFAPRFSSRLLQPPLSVLLGDADLSGSLAWEDLAHDRRGLREVAIRSPSETERRRNW